MSNTALHINELIKQIKLRVYWIESQI